MNTNEKLYGFFSQKAIDEDCSSSIYSTSDGKEVEVTFATKDLEGKDYQWEDKVFIGEVTTWIRRGVYSDTDRYIDDELDRLAVERDYDEEEY